MGEAHFQRWMLIVREHLLSASVPHAAWQSYDWRAAHDDGQTPSAAVRAFLASRSK